MVVLKLTKIKEIPEIANNLNIETANAEAERNWVIEKIKKGEYCLTSGMRGKDREYFRSWKRIDPVECAMHGMFLKKD